jgi:hypothetical protein
LVSKELNSFTAGFVFLQGRQATFTITLEVIADGFNPISLMIVVGLTVFEL